MESNPPPISPMLQRMGMLVILLALITGTAIRLGLYLSPHSLWSDEAAVAFNLMDRDYRGLFKRLDHEQHAPIGFLLVTKFICELFGYQERAFWGVSILSGSLLPFLLWRLLARVCSLPGVVMGVVLAALSPPLIQYSCELKPYILDAAVTCLLLLMYLPVARHVNGTAMSAPINVKREALKGIVSAVLVLFSFPAVFVLTGITSYRLLSSVRNKDYRRSILLGAFAIPFTLVFSLYYLLLLRSTSQSNFLHDFWLGAFLSVPKSPYACLINLKLLLVPFGDCLGFDFRLAGFLAVVGCVLSLQSKSRNLLILFALVFALTGFASLIHKWPFNIRLMLFIVPFTLIIIARGIEVIAQLLPKSAWLPLLGSLLLGPLIMTNELMDTIGEPRGMSHVATVLENEGKPSDTVLVYYLAAPEFEYYRRRGRFAGIDPVNTTNLIQEPWSVCETQLDALPPESRIWVVFGNLRMKPFDERQAIRFHLLRQRKEVLGIGDYLSLFDSARDSSESN